MKKTTIVLLALLTALAWTAVANAQITSAGSGSWTAGATWVGGLVPTSVDDVLIASGHTISVDDVNAECRSVTFGGDDALIDINANSMLTVYGDFTIFSTSHVAFSGGLVGDQRLHQVRRFGRPDSQRLEHGRPVRPRSAT